MTLICENGLLEEGMTLAGVPSGARVGFVDATIACPRRPRP